MRAIFVSILLTCCIISSCTEPSTALTDAEKSTLIADVRQTLHQYYADIRREGLLAEFKYLDPSPDFFWVPPGYTQAIGYDSVAAVLRQNAKSVRTMDNAWDTLRVVPLSKELATYTGRIRSTVMDTSGLTTAFLLQETGVVIRREDGWKLLHGQTVLLNGNQ